MIKKIRKNQKFSIIPQEVKGAANCKVVDVAKTTFDVSLPLIEQKYYNEGERVELFSAIKDGMLYFETTVDKITPVGLKLKQPKNNELLQRREFLRTELCASVILKDNIREVECDCVDISAGGMKVSLKEPIETNGDYIIKFTLDGKIYIDCFFRPVRLLKGKKGTHLLSGRFIALKNIDKIAIVQYCLKKQTENTNK